MFIEIKEYLDANGHSPYGNWFDDLDARAAAKIAGAMDKIGRGLLSNVESVGGGVLEKKIDFGPGYRVYFGPETDGRTMQVVILLCAGTKKSQRMDVAVAKAYWQDYKTRKRRNRN